MMCNSCSSIRFQNPSYDRRDEVEVTLDSLASNLSPGQHEYVNPIDNKYLSMKVSNFTLERTTLYFMIFIYLHLSSYNTYLSVYKFCITTRSI